MNTQPLARGSLLCSAVLACLLPAQGHGQPPAPEEKRIQELEKRVKELEKTVAKLQEQLARLTEFGPPVKPELDRKLLGSWGEADPKAKGLVGLRLEADGSCKIVARVPDIGLSKYKGKYQIVGKTILIRGTYEDGSGNIDRTLTVVSVTDKELVIQSPFDRDEVTGFAKAIENRLERQ